MMMAQRNVAGDRPVDIQPSKTARSVEAFVNNGEKDAFVRWLTENFSFPEKSCRQLAQFLENGIKILGSEKVHLALEDYAAFENYVDNFDFEKAGWRTYWKSKIKRGVRYWVDWVRSSEGIQPKGVPADQLLGPGTSERARNAGQLARQRAGQKTRSSAKSGGSESKSARQSGSAAAKPAKPAKSASKAPPQTQAAATAPQAAEASVKSAQAGKSAAVGDMHKAVESVNEGEYGYRELVDELAASLWDDPNAGETSVVRTVGLALMQISPDQQFRMLMSLDEALDAEDPYPSVPGTGVRKVMGGVLLDRVSRDVMAKLDR